MCKRLQRSCLIEELKPHRFPRPYTDSCEKQPGCLGMIGSPNLLHPPHFTGGIIKVPCLWRHPELVLEAKGSPGELVSGDGHHSEHQLRLSRSLLWEHLGSLCSEMDALPSRLAGEERTIYCNIMTPQLSPRAQEVKFIVIHSASLRYGGCQQLPLSPPLNLHSTAARTVIVIGRLYAPCGTGSLLPWEDVPDTS